MINTKKLVTAAATVAILANALTPLVFADTTITVTGNGASSSNSSTVNNTTTTSVSQSNNASITNNVSGKANSGGNTADYNVGGAVSVQTGAASVSNTVSNSANQNYANVSCGCDSSGNTLVKVAGNGASSGNNATLNNYNATTVGQSNSANFSNTVGGSANSGNNNANYNTGGAVSVTTGPASVSNSVSNWANANSAVVGGNGLGGGSTSLIIAGNGTGARSSITDNDTNAVSVSQGNGATITNNLKGDANSGGNTADYNGGAVTISTGAASAHSSVDNMANFNWADLSCGCTVDGGLTASVDGNGANTSNAITANLVSSQALGQGNTANLNNILDCLVANSGNNDANYNVGAHVDPSVMTGPASTSSDVSNTANLNGEGGSAPVWPTWDMGGVHVSINFSLSALLGALGLV